MKKLIIIALLFLTLPLPTLAQSEMAEINETSSSLITFEEVNPKYLDPEYKPPEPEEFRALITEIKNEPCYDMPEQTCKSYTLKILEGDKKDEIIKSKESANYIETEVFKKGDKVFVSSFDNFGEIDWFINGHVREESILLLIIIFIILTILVGRIQGFGSIIGLAITIVIIFGLTIPMILKGVNPILIGIFSAMLILAISVYFSHGFNRKSTIAIISTFLGIVVVGILSIIFINLAKLSGVGQEEAFYLTQDFSELNMRGVLFVSIIIAGIGIIDDLTVNLVSSMEQIYTTNPKLTRSELVAKTMVIGRDHIASMVNTLFIAYAAASMPFVMLLYANQGNTDIDILNSNFFVEDIVRTFIGSIGLVVVVPITTYIASLWIMRKGGRENNRIKKNKMK